MAIKLDKVSSATLDSAFGSSDYSDEEGFEVLDSIVGKHNGASAEGALDQNPMKLVSKGKINETKIIPLMLYTDVFTAEQTVLLLDMIRFCMEKSSEGKSDDVKEFTINVHIKNRSKSDFVVSIGDESQDAIAYEKDVYIGH